MCLNCNIPLTVRCNSVVILLTTCRSFCLGRHWESWENWSCHSAGFGCRKNTDCLQKHRKHVASILSPAIPSRFRNTNDTKAVRISNCHKNLLNDTHKKNITGSLSWCWKSCTHCSWVHLIHPRSRPLHRMSDLDERNDRCGSGKTLCNRQHRAQLTDSVHVQIKSAPFYAEQFGDVLGNTNCVGYRVTFNCVDVLMYT